MIISALLCLSAGQSFAGSRVDWLDGGPRLVVNGKPLPATVAAGVYYIPDPRMSGKSGVPDYRDPLWVSRMEGIIDRVSGDGGKLVLINIWWSDFDKSKTRPAPIDKNLNFKNFDSVMDYAAGKEVYLMPVLTFAPGLPEWWLKENRFPPFDGKGQCDSCETDSYGNHYNNPSMGSEITRRDFGGFLAAFTGRYRSHPALAGWSFGVGATGEDNYGPNYIYFMSVGGSRAKTMKPLMFTDYSPSFQRRFKTWLKAKYKTDAALQSAWNDERVTLAGVGVPRPKDMVRKGKEPRLFPDPADLWWGFDTDNLTKRGLDFYEFRNLTRAEERRYYASLFKKNDPDHVLFFNSSMEETLSDPEIDGITLNPNLNFGAKTNKLIGDWLFNVITRIVTPAVRHKKAVLSVSENVSDGMLFQSTGRWESEGQLDYIETFGKSVKCAGGMFGYTVDLQGRDAENHWLPTWFSDETRQAGRRIAEYKPGQDCACALVRATYLKNGCSGKSLETGCGQLNKAYHSFCNIPEEPGHEHRKGPPEGGKPRRPGAGKNGLCGDGVCDKFERAHAELCPQDCR